MGHTPGPWLPDFHREQQQGGRFITHVHAVGHLVPIAAVPTGVEGYGREEGRANARLIAAGPDYHEAAPDAADYLERYAAFIREDVKADDLERHPYVPAIEDCARALRAAIARAQTGDAA